MGVFDNNLKKKLGVLGITITAFFISQLPYGQAAAPTSGLIGYWKFDETSGSTASDSSGSNLNATITSGTWAAGKINNALQLNGTLTFGVTPTINLGNTFSISSWVYNPTNNPQSTYARIAETKFDLGFFLGANSNGSKYKFIVKNAVGSTGGCGFALGCAEGGTVTSGWHLISGTYDGATAKLYVDGAQVASDTFTAPGSTNLPMYMGRRNISANYWSGSLDEMRLYNRELLASEILDIYNDAPVSPPPPPPNPTPPPPPTPIAGGPEIWPGLNKDGGQANSNTRPLSGTPRLRWSKDLRGFGVVGNYYPNNPNTGRRSWNFSVRDGRILLVAPIIDPSASFHIQNYVTYSVYSLANGSLQASKLSPQAGPQYTFGADSNDIPGGFISQYWASDGNTYTMTGGDSSLNARFNPYTGEFPLGQTPAIQKYYNDKNKFASDRSWVYHGVDASGIFNFIDSNPLTFGVGHWGAATMYVGSNAYGLIDGGGFADGDNSLPFHNGFLLDNQTAYTFKPYGVDNTFVYYGTKILARRILTSPPYYSNTWTYQDPTRLFLSFSNAPRAFAIAEDSHIYFYGHWIKDVAGVRSPDWARGMVLTGVRKSDGVSDVSIPISYDINAESKSLGGSGLSTGYNPYILPQIATLGDRVVVFQPQQPDLPNLGHVFAFSTASKSLIWQYDYPVSAFSTGVQDGTLWKDTAQAVQLTIAGDSAYIVEPRVVAGKLVLRVDKFNLLDGSKTTTDIPLQISVTDPSTVSLRELAAVDGALVALVDYDFMYQTLAVIEGSTNPQNSFSPVAVISEPVTGMPIYHELPLSDFPPTPTNQIDSGQSFSFSGTGSMDPDGGNVTYFWDFGDGTTSSAQSGTHIYTNSGTAGTITSRTVTLTVRDDEGSTSTAVTRQMAVRNVGTVVTQEFSAAADASLNEYFTTNNYGTLTLMTVSFVESNGLRQRGLIKFDLGSLNLSSIKQAVLRLWVPPGGASVNNVLMVKKTTSGWIESSVNWANAPAVLDNAGTKLLPFYPQYGYWLDIPITEAVRQAGGQNVSFALELMDRKNPEISFGTKESNKAAKLIIKSGDPGYAAPTITTEPPANVIITAAQLTSGASLSIAATSPLNESALSYNWQQVSGPGKLTFNSNNTNSAKSTLITPSVAGTYALVCVVYDGLQSTISRLVTITDSGNPSSTPVVGDINNDHIVNSIDYSILNSKWFSVDPTSDFNTDGIVNAIDYSILSQNWFKTW